MSPKCNRSLKVLGFAFVFLIAGCGGGGDPIDHSGFYRRSDQSTVYKYDKNADSLCIVENVAQMDAMGGFSAVRIVSANTDIVGEHQPQNCQWPNGVYRNVNATTTYELSGTTACKLAGSHPNAIVLGASEDVLVGRKFTGSCTKAATH
jgi:hypothetical protein